MAVNVTQVKSTDALTGLDEVKKRLAEVSSSSKERIAALQSDLNTAMEVQATLHEDIARLQDTRQALETRNAGSQYVYRSLMCCLFYWLLLLRYYRA